MATDTKPRTPGTKPSARTEQARTEQARTEQARTGRQISSPRHTRPTAPAPAAKPSQAAKPAQASRPSLAGERQRRRQQYRQQRMPFILLLVGLLGGALVSLLVISTTLDEGSYRINNLTSENNALYKDEQTLLNEVNQERDPAVIASEAAVLGLRPQKDERFINTATQTIVVVPAVTAP
jgi:hypothetical protein